MRLVVGKLYKVEVGRNDTLGAMLVGYDRLTKNPYDIGHVQILNQSIIMFVGKIEIKLFKTITTDSTETQYMFLYGAKVIRLNPRQLKQIQKVGLK